MVQAQTEVDKEQAKLLIGSMPVYFKAVPGKYKSCSGVEINEAEHSEETVAQLLKNKKPVVSLEDTLDEDQRPSADEIQPNMGTYVPCVPNLELIVKEKEEDPDVPALLARTLIKCKKEFADQEVQGFASGKRSAILIAPDDSESYIRLKGCGNLDQGFPLEKMGEPFLMQAYEVRGCGYKETCYREMLYQGRVNELLEKSQLSGANFPLGVWKYSSEFAGDEAAGLVNKLQHRVDKYCGVFRTVGDRRLQTNLVQGLNRLVKDVMRSNVAGYGNQGAVESFLNLFRQKNRVNEKNEVLDCARFKKNRGPAKAELHTDFIAANRIYTDEENAILYDFFKDGLDRDPIFTQFAIILQQIQASQLGLRLPENELLVLEANLNKIRQAEPGVVAQAIPLIFMRCGAECGKIKRVMDEAMISWGFFSDHIVYIPHCNAHPNNLVVMDPTKNEHNNLLGVLDLDLAYNFDSFVNTIDPNPEIFTDQENLEIQSKLYGTQDREQFDAWNNSEKYELEVALGGQENMDNFIFGMRRENSVEQPGEEKQCIETASSLMVNLLQDFCARTYREHYDRLGWLWVEDRSGHPSQEAYIQALPVIQSLIYIAILLTKEEKI